jgi:predicted HNH restriction endonuclease
MPLASGGFFALGGNAFFAAVLSLTFPCLTPHETGNREVAERRGMAEMTNNGPQAPYGSELPSVEQLCSPVLHTLQAFGGSGLKEKIYAEIVTMGQIPRELGNKKRKMKSRFTRSLTSLEEDGLVSSLNAIWSLTDKGKEVLAPGRVARHGAVYARNPAIRAAVMKRANGKCEFCGEPGFTGVDGTPYLECHHIIALANVGMDRMTNVIALCANHHREVHFGEQRDEIEKQMIRIVRKAEAQRRKDWLK